MNLVRDVMLNDSTLCTPLTSIDNIQRIMKEHGRNEVLIVDTMEEKHLVGLINGDTISKVSHEKSVLPSQLNAEQCMTPVLATVGQNASVDECLQIMEDHHLSRIPVVDDRGHWCGVVDKEGVELIPM